MQSDLVCQLNIYHHCCPNWQAFIESPVEIIVLLDGFLSFSGSGFNFLAMMLSQLPESEIRLFL